MPNDAAIGPTRPMLAPALSAGDAARLDASQVFERLDTTESGLRSAVAAERLRQVGPNALRTHRTRAWTVLVRQVRSPLLALLVAAAVVSFYVGERTDAVIIGVIVSLSVGLGFVNEFRAERASEALHTQLRHRSVVRRDDEWTSCDVVELVPGDVIRLTLGAVVPADARLISTAGLECDESVLTGESLPVDKAAARVVPGSDRDPLSSCCLMGTIVHAGSGDAVVIATGPRTAFGKIATGLGEAQDETEFQAGLREFSRLLAGVAGVLTTVIFAINLVLQRPLIDALLFSLAIAVGITPQLLPAVVTTSLATGSRRLAHRRVLVKRLVCIEDLGNIATLLTDKTGTLTEGRISFRAAIDAAGAPSDRCFALGLVCNEASAHGADVVGGNSLDVALWSAPGAPTADAGRYRRSGIVPFDHDRRIVSVLADGPDGRQLIAKGAPEAILERCRDVTAEARALLQAQFDQGMRVVALAVRDATGIEAPSPRDECDLTLVGLLTFLDQPKASAKEALDRLAGLGVAVKVVTGDNAAVAQHVCRELGLRVDGTLTGNDIAALDDDALLARLASTTIFARVNPEQKARIVALHRRGGSDVAYLGDGVNDAVALHKADVGISVDSATDVAKDAADVLLLDKDLDVLANGVVEGRRIFANTVKYVLMGTSSNFGNMFSAAAASAFLSFLPMLPSQILLNNLLYDAGQMAIPTDRVDDEQLARPAHWDIGFIRRFMMLFGPISSLFDFVTFAVMLHVFDAGPDLFRSGWFVESLATQSLVIFVIRTRRVPFVRSRASTPLTVATLVVVAAASVLPFSPFAHTLGFQSLPVGFFGVLVLMVAGYLAIVEAAKREFYAHLAVVPLRHASAEDLRRMRRRAARFSRRAGGNKIG